VTQFLQHQYALKQQARSFHVRVPLLDLLSRPLFNELQFERNRVSLCKLRVVLRTEVYLYMYDISAGLARRWTSFKTVKSQCWDLLQGIWHTGVVVCWPTKFPSAGTQYWQGEKINVTTGSRNLVEKRFLGYTSGSTGLRVRFREKAAGEANELPLAEQQLQPLLGCSFHVPVGQAHP
ncbi:abhd17c, partial [Symbiodinium pilosum]